MKVGAVLVTIVKPFPDAGGGKADSARVEAGAWVRGVLHHGAVTRTEGARVGVAVAVEGASDAHHVARAARDGQHLLAPLETRAHRFT